MNYLKWKNFAMKKILSWSFWQCFCQRTDTKLVLVRIHIKLQKYWCWLKRLPPKMTHTIEAWTTINKVFQVISLKCNTNIIQKKLHTKDKSDISVSIVERFSRSNKHEFPSVSIRENTRNQNRTVQTNGMLEHVLSNVDIMSGWENAPNDSTSTKCNRGNKANHSRRNRPLIKIQTWTGMPRFSTVMPRLMYQRIYVHSSESDVNLRHNLQIVIRATIWAAYLV